jgi:hypothetical protein
MSQHSRTSSRTLVLGLVTMAGLAVLLAWLCHNWWKSADPARKPRNGTPFQQAGEPGSRPKQSTVGGQEADGSPMPRASDPGTAAPATNSGESHDDGPIGDSATLQVRVNQRDGSAVPGLMFKCTVLAGTARSQQSLGSVIKTTDEAGIFDVSFGAGSAVGIVLLSKNWYADQSRVTRVKRLHEIVVSPTATVSVLAEFDDGQPVTSSGMFYPESAPPYIATFALDATGRATVPDVAVDRPLRCEINGNYRAGYSSHWELFQPATLTSGATLRVVVPRASEPYGNIRIVFREEPPAASRRVFLECEGRSALESEFPGGKRRWDSPKLMAGFRYRVNLLGDTSWRSDWLEIRAGEVVEVFPMLMAAASVKAVLVDEQGRPVVNATLGIEQSFGFSYQWPGRGFLRQGAQSPVPRVLPQFLSDAEGRITLTGLPPGSHRLEAEGWDTESNAMAVELAEGQTLDLGTLTLRKATGEISLTLTGTSPDTRYVVSLCDSDGRDLRPGQLVTGLPFTLAGLRRRTYQLYVTTDKGGAVAHQRVDVSATATSVEVTVDVSNLRAPK